MTTAALVGEVRASKSGREFECRAVTYGTVDDYGSVWAPGVFTRSLERRLPVVAWGHDWSDPIGRVTSWRDGKDALVLAGRLSDPAAVPRARQAAAQLRDGDITEVSVGFSKAKRRPLTDDERRRWPGAVEVIESAELQEVSLVLAGAVPGAEILSVRNPHGRRGLPPLGPVEARWIGEAKRVAAELDRAADDALDGVFRGWSR